MKKKINRTLKLLFSFFICFFAAFIGSIFTKPSINGWYVYINKPSFTPPNWIFGPVWTVLYALMAVSLYIVWIKKQKSMKPYLFFGLQLSFNVLWSILFFGFHSILLAFFNIILLWFFVLLTILNFYKVSKISAYLFIPYFVWISFASLLNFYILILN
ncbi:MAG: TspO/MBR family protein [Candidatus Woesearchaeota archaeon]